MKTTYTPQDQNVLPSRRPAEGRERRLINELIESMQHPAAVISEIAVGSHFIGIRAEDSGADCVGLAATLGAGVTAEAQRLLDQLPGTPLAQAAALLKSHGAFAISLGAAALNAGLVPPPDLPDLEASRIMAEKGRHGETVLVGEFPLTDWLREQVETLHLFELPPWPPTCKRRPRPTPSSSAQRRHCHRCFSPAGPMCWPAAGWLLRDRCSMPFERECRSGTSKNSECNFWPGPGLKPSPSKCRLPGAAIRDSAGAFFRLPARRGGIRRRRWPPAKNSAGGGGSGKTFAPARDRRRGGP